MNEKGIMKMEFMNLFTGKKTRETESTRNAACYADQPNEECSSIEKIRKLQDEIESLRNEKEKLDLKSPYSIIYNINNSDENIAKQLESLYINIHGYNRRKEIENCWLDFISLFKSLEDKSKTEIIDYLKTEMNTKQIIVNYNSQINVLENEIQLEKQKLGIK